MLACIFYETFISKLLKHVFVNKNIHVFMKQKPRNAMKSNAIPTHLFMM